MSARAVYSVHKPSKPDCGLDIPQWLPIATLEPSRKQYRWREADDAPVSPKEARRMVDQGTLLMAQRRDDGDTVLVIKTPTGKHRENSRIVENGR